jgi:hypothetical protein
MNWRVAGHASLLVRHRPAIVDTIVTAFDRSEALHTAT